MTSKRLFIPHKTTPKAHQPEYGNDMRAIEIFNPINQLVAGSGVTLNPADGTGPQVEISTSGGGGGANWSYFKMQVGPENYGFEPTAGGMYLSPNDAPDTTGISQFLLQSRNAPAIIGDFIDKDIGTSWMSYVGPGESALQWPLLTAPTFSNATFITVGLLISAFSVTSTTDLLGGTLQAQQMNTSSPDIQLTSGQIYQTTAADFPAVIQSFGGDLSLVAGTGDGTGFVSASGDFMYFGSAIGLVNYVDATFT